MGFGLKNLMADAELKKEEKEKYQGAFSKFDKNKDGELDVKELAKLLKNCHYEFDGDTVESIMKMSDLDGTGTLNEKEFLYFMANVSRAKHTFKKFDKDGNGSLSRKELHTLLNDAGFKFSEGQTEVFYPMVDKDNSNSISMEEFLKLAVFLRFTVIQFMLCDTDQSGSLDAKEVHKHLPALGLKVDEATTNAIVGKLDTDKSGQLEPNEFALLVAMLKLE